MGFVRIFWKNNQEAYLPKTSISEQIVSGILAQLCSDDFIQILLNWTQFNIRNRVRFRRICMESSEHNWANISETIGPKMLVFGK